MKRIVLHWTSGVYYPNEHEKECYHFLIDKDGVIHEGKYKPEDNEICTDGRYAAHTGGGNTGSVGVAFCGMMGCENPQNVGDYPLTQKQVEAGFKLCATLIKKYNLQLSNVITHYEFGKLHPESASAGKIDITYLPSYPDVKAEEMGGFIRSKIRWYLERI